MKDHDLELEGRQTPPTPIMPNSIEIERSKVVDKTSMLDAVTTGSTYVAGAQVKNPTILASSGSTSLTTNKTFYYPDYNFSEIITISEIESLVPRSFAKKVSLALKEGGAFVGKNAKLVEYVKQRFHEIAASSGKTFFKMLREIVENLVWFSNYFCVVVRDKNKSSGIIRDGKKPIAGLFTVPMYNLVVSYDDKGRIDEVGQNTGINKPIKSFKKGDWFQCKMHCVDGANFGTPTLIASKDDIRSLRRTEEYIENSLYQFVSPLIAMYVGDKDNPPSVYPDGTTEVDRMADVYATLPSDGGIVLDYRHKLEAVSTKLSGFPYEGALEHFHQRTITGIDSSRIDLGEGDTSNRSTADSISRSTIDIVKNIQDEVEEFLYIIIQELLKESTFDQKEIFSIDNEVRFEFAEIDLDNLIKLENHALNVFNANGITHKEFRQALGKEEMSSEEMNDTFSKKFKEEETNAAAAAKSVIQPSNQHGTKSSPRKTSDSFDMANRTLVMELWNSITSVVDHLERYKVGSLLSTAKNDFTRSLRAEMDSYFSMGRDRARSEIGVQLGFSSYIGIDIQQNETAAHVMDLFFNDLLESIEANQGIKPSDVMSKYSNRLRTIVTTECQRSLNAGKIAYYKTSGIDNIFVYSPNDNSCDDCKKVKILTDMRYAFLPPFTHPNSIEEVFIKERS